MAVIPGGGTTTIATEVRVYQTTGAPTSNASDVQTVTLTGATGGTFTLTFGGQTTTPLAFNATAAAVQAALVALSNIGPADVQVTGNAGGPYTVTFVGALANAPQPVLVATGAALTGTTPTVAVAHTATGSTATFGSVAPKGALLSDIANANLYINTGTQVNPTWAAIAHA